MRQIILTVSIAISSLLSNAQGYLMLAGGAGESAGGWSDSPYSWVVSKASNKRIAVISYNSGETDWIPNYFKSFGAVYAKNFYIPDKTTANQQALYDSLITYNGVFIKGGDQGKYYQYYKDTKVQQALQYIYNNGGVLSGTSAGSMILSPVVYTAQVASIDPATALMSAYSTQITLVNDFLTTIGGNFIFDTHVAERGRFGRIPSFMATWYKSKTLNAVGVGIDDHTALCIEPNGNAVVYGTGAVGFYKTSETTLPFDINVSMLKSKYIQFTQAIHGCTFNINTLAITGLNRNIQPKVAEENGKYRVFICGTDYPSDNAYSYIVSQVGAASDPIVIVTGNDLTRANDIKTNLQSKGATNVDIIKALTSYSNDQTYQTKISAAKKFVIVSNGYTDFINFTKASGNGALLKQRLLSNDMVSFFVGDNARFAGKTVINKYTGAGYASYRGELEFLSGLELLKTTSIMPNTFISAETYENTVTGLPYAMMKDSLKYGLYITGNTFAEYGYGSNGKAYFKNLSGSFPLIFLKNTGTKSGMVNQGPYATSRNIAGFEQMYLRFLGEADTVVVGNNVPVSVPIKTTGIDVKIFPNPASELINIQGKERLYNFQMIDLTGRLVLSRPFTYNTTVELDNFTNGYYLIKVTDVQSRESYTAKVCIINKK